MVLAVGLGRDCLLHEYLKYFVLLSGDYFQLSVIPSPETANGCLIYIVISLWRRCDQTRDLMLSAPLKDFKIPSLTYDTSHLMGPIRTKI